MTTALTPRAKHGSDHEGGISAGELLARYAEAGFDRPTRATRRDGAAPQNLEQLPDAVEQTVVTRDAPAGLGPVGLVRGGSADTGAFGRRPKAVVATLGATMVGATAVMGVVSTLETPGDGPGDPQSRPVDLAGSESATMKLSVPQTGAGQAAPGGHSAAGSSLAQNLTRAGSLVPSSFDQADAARIAANNLSAAKKASAERAKAAAAHRHDGDDANGDDSSSDSSAGDSVKSDAAGSSLGAQALAQAITKMGKPYVWGADGPNAFDCSGLMKWAFEQIGKDLPRSSSAQSQVGESVSKSDLKPGDLVFFYSPVSHVGIYAGNGKVLNAPTEGESVKYTDIDRMPFHNAQRIS